MTNEIVVNKKEFCRNCSYYSADLMGWCWKHLKLKNWNDTCNKFKKEGK